jgi:hypothetical protein
MCSTHAPHNIVICTACGVCKKCHNDACDFEHPTRRGKAGDEVRQRRKHARYEEDGEAALASISALRVLADKDLNEDRLFASIDALIAQPEEIASGGPFQQIEEALGIEGLSRRLVNRARLFDEESFQNTETLTSVSVGMELIAKHIAKHVTTNDAASRVLLRNVESRALERVAKTNPLDNIADAFIRSGEESIQRSTFALLLQSAGSKLAAKNALDEALGRAMGDSNFLEATPARYYIIKKPGANATRVELPVARQLEMKYSWIMSREKIARAVADLKLLALGKPPEKQWNKPRVSLDSILNALKFLETLSVGWKGGATQTVTLGEGTKLSNVPVLNMSLSADSAFTHYSDEANKDPQGLLWGAKRIGQGTFQKLYSSIGKLIADKHALSYYYTGMLDCFDLLERMLKRMIDLYNQYHEGSVSAAHWTELNDLPFEPTNLFAVIDSSRDHGKYSLRSHIVFEECDGVSMHCSKLATGAPCSKSHSIGDGKCARCENFIGVAQSLRRLMNAFANGLGREHNDQGIFSRENKDGPVAEILSMARPITFCGKTLDLYVRHVMRGAVMNRAIAKVADDLPVGTLLVILDHKQKIQPINFNESSEEYFGKKGISMLGASARYRLEPEGPLSTRYYDVPSSNNKQNAFQVQSLLNLMVPEFKMLVPGASQFILISDNGSAFSGAENLAFCWARNNIQWGCGLTLTRWMFFEAQCGKTTLDTHFSFATIVFRRFARAVRPIKNYRDVFDALCSEGGISNSLALQVTFNVDDSSGDVEEEEGAFKIDQVRKIHDVHFRDGKVFTYHYAGVEYGMKEQTSLSLGSSARALGSATIDGRFASQKILQPRQSTPKTHGTIAASFSSSSRPFERLMADGLVIFGTEHVQQAAPVLLPVPVLTSVAEPESGKSGKKKKSKHGAEEALADDDSIFPSFEANWASAANRPRAEMPESLTRVVEKMVRRCF